MRTTVIPNRNKSAIQTEVRKHVEAGAALFTDALKSYEGLSEFQHQVVDHAGAVCGRKRAHERLRELLESAEAHAARNLR